MGRGLYAVRLTEAKIWHAYNNKQAVTRQGSGGGEEI